jgi:hypothetical protein
MTRLVLRREIDLGAFGVQEWTESQYATPIVLHLGNARISIFVKKAPTFVKLRKKKVDVLPHGHMEIVFDPAPNSLLEGLKKRSAARSTAKEIYARYIEAMKRFEALLMSAGNQRYLYWVRILPEDEFFGTRGLHDEGITWSVDGGEEQQFSLKLPVGRRVNPMYKSDQLVTFAKWQKIQQAAVNSDVPNGELFELYRIRVKAHTVDPKIAAIEASIISETLLRQYSLQVLQAEGFSKGKIKQIKDELTFNYLLNVVLPLSLTRSEFSRIRRSVQSVDSLRKLRNDIVHGNTGAAEIDRDTVIDGVEGAIRLVNFLKLRRQTASESG